MNFGQTSNTENKPSSVFKTEENKQSGNLFGQNTENKQSINFSSSFGEEKKNIQLNNENKTSSLFQADSKKSENPNSKPSISLFGAAQTDNKGINFGEKKEANSNIGFTASQTENKNIALNKPADQTSSLFGAETKIARI